MSTIINTGTTITEPFDFQLQNQTIEIGSTTTATAAVIFSGDSLLSMARPSVDTTSEITGQVPGQTTAETARLGSLGIFINAGTIAANGPAGSTLTIDIEPSGSTIPGRFINDGLITVAAGNTALVTLGSNSAFTMGVGQSIGTFATLSVAGSGALDIGTPGTDAAAGAVNVGAGQSLIASGLIDSAVVNDGTVGSSNSGAIGTSTSGTLEITGSVSGAGTLVLGGGTTLKLDGGVSGQSIVFNTGAPETLVLGTPGSGFTQAISNFQDLDSIAFSNGTTLNSAILNGTTLKINTSAGLYLLPNFALAANTGTAFSVSPDHGTITLSNRTFNWKPVGGSTDFGTSTNWQPAGPPGSNDFATFTTNVASGTITGTGTVGELQFGASTPWVLDGADIVDTLNVLVGQPNGTLTLIDGATLDGRSSEADLIGSATGDIAAATVSGSGTTWKTLGSLVAG
ncbi:MAG TPA: hypothetical protein VLI93_15770, partial [Acetobacteraceae bacterium]|nr:hypothetical protein [Acetobacteraceae bacterium]